MSRRPDPVPAPPSAGGRRLRWALAVLAVLGYGLTLLTMAHHAGPDQPVVPVVQLDQ